MTKSALEWKLAYEIQKAVKDQSADFEKMFNNKIDLGNEAFKEMEFTATLAEELDLKLEL